MKYRPHRVLIMLAMAVTWLVVIGQVRTAQAGLAGCRTDPILWFGNGDKLSISTAVDVLPRDLIELHYIVRAPDHQADDQTGVKIVSTGLPPGAKETVEVKFDLPDNSPYAYTVDTVAYAKGDPVAVSVTMRLDRQSTSTTGLTGRWLWLGVAR
jgi:hypothetical protein